MHFSESVLTSDVLLACLFPLFVLFLAFKLSPPLTWSDFRELLSLAPSTASQHGPFSLARAHRAYAQYSRLAASDLARTRSSYATLGRAHKRLGYKIGYPAKLERLKHVTDLNATITDGIAELAQREFGLGGDAGGGAEVGGVDLGRVRESLKHYVRDWSGEGAEERGRMFAPVLDVLRRVEPDLRSQQTVLVPGSGLGRLAWEISELGFNTTANELSFFMNLSLRFLLSPETTSSKNQHVLRPFAHWFSHQRTNDSLFRPVPFPDVVPRLGPNFCVLETDFLTLPVPSDDSATPGSSSAPFWAGAGAPGTSSAGYDFVVTLFFIDTSQNVFATLEHIYALLRPGGTWINLGPLLWTSGGQAKLELSLEELLQAAEEIGFIIEQGDGGGDGDARRTVECEYTADLTAMMRWIYRAEFWVARKSK